MRPWHKLVTKSFFASLAGLLLVTSCTAEPNQDKAPIPETLSEVITVGEKSVYDLRHLYRDQAFKQLPEEDKKAVAVLTFLQGKWKDYRRTQCSAFAVGLLKFCLLSCMLYLAVDYLKCWWPSATVASDQTTLGKFLTFCLKLKVTQQLKIALDNFFIPILRTQVMTGLKDLYTPKRLQGSVFLLIWFVLPPLFAPFKGNKKTLPSWAITHVIGLPAFYLHWLFARGHQELIEPLKHLIRIYYHGQYPFDIMEPVEKYYISEKHNLPEDFITAVEALFMQIRKSKDMKYIREQLKNIDDGITLYSAVRVNYSPMNERQRKAFVAQGKKLFALYPKETQEALISVAYAIRTGVPINPILLAGEAGVGKTHALELLAKFLCVSIAYTKIEAASPDKFLGTSKYLGDLPLAIVETFRKDGTCVGFMSMEEIEKVLHPHNPEAQKHLVTLLKLFDTSPNTRKIDEHNRVKIYLPMFNSWLSLPLPFSLVNYGEVADQIPLPAAYKDRHQLIIIPPHTAQSKLRFLYNKDPLTGISKLEAICKQLGINIKTLPPECHAAIEKMTKEDTSPGLRAIEANVRNYLNKLLMEGKLKK